MSDRGLSDLEVLLNKIRDKEIKQYAEEAINCYYAKSYRAAIITIWVATVLDLYKKIEYIYSTFTDPGAKETLDVIISARENNKALEWERQILDNAKDKVKIINKEQYDRLKRIESDRHKCAHPVMDDEGILYQPTAEEARAHIRNSVDILLSQNAIFGKNFAETIISQIEGPYMGEEKESIQSQIKKYIEHSNDIFRQQLIILLLKKLLCLDITNTEKNWIKYTNTLLILFEFNEKDFILLKQKFIEITNRTTNLHLKYLIKLLYFIPTLIEFVPESMIDKIEQYAEKDGNIETRLQTLSYSSRIFDTIIDTYLDLAKWVRGAGYYDTSQQMLVMVYIKNQNLCKTENFQNLLNTSIDNFLNSKNLDMADKYEEGLILLIKEFNEEQVSRLLEKAPQNYSNQFGSNQLVKTQRFFTKLYLNTKDKFQNLQNKWEEFIKLDFLIEPERLKWVIEGNSIDDYVED